MHDGCAYVRAKGDRSYEPDLLEGSVIHITKNASDAELVRFIVHEVGHFLGLGDYGLGCHRITGNTAVKSAMSYRWRVIDWRDWQNPAVDGDGDVSNDVGVLVDHVLSDGSTQKAFQLNLTFDAGEVSGLRGKQFVIAGVTRTQFVGSASARASVSLNLLTDDPASETWWGFDFYV